MRRILIRCGKDPRQPLSAEASLARNGWGVFGGNVGNLLFMSSVHRALSVPGTEVIANSLLTELPGANEAYIARINSEFDSFVVPLANAFRVSFLPSLRRLTAAILKMKIPVTVVGVGAQLPLSAGVQDIPEPVRSATKAFVKAVLDHSASIGVRGETSFDFLRSLGFGSEVIDVIGCPSLFHSGRGPQVTKRRQTLSTGSLLSMNVTPSVTRFASFIEAHVRRYPNLVYVPQEAYELEMLLWGGSAPPKDVRIPTHTSHPLYQQDRVLFFLDASTWVGYLQAVDLSFGTRIHGNIAALMAGTPALVIAHDSRTRELAEYHRIPFREAATLDLTADIGQLYEELDFEKFNGAQPELFEHYRRFLDKNGIVHVFRPDHANPAYDEELAKVSFPDPVRNTINNGALDPQAVLARLRWLRQGAGTDQERQALGYIPPFSPQPQGIPGGRPSALRGSSSLEGLSLCTSKRLEAEPGDRAVAEIVEELNATKERLMRLERMVAELNTSTETPRESSEAKGAS